MTRITLYNKLVRDGMPKIIAKDHHRAAFRRLDEAEFRHELRRKLAEEVAEYLECGSVDELVDVYTVLSALAELHYPEDGLDKIHALAERKWDKRGGFEDRLFLLFVERPEISGEVTYDLS